MRLSPLLLRFRNPGSVWFGVGLLVLVFLVLASEATAQPTTQSPVPLPVPFNPIVDNANVIDAGTRQRLEAIYLNLKERGNIEYAVLTVNTTGGRDIFDYSLAVARGWGIGPKDAEKAGLLLVVAIHDRKYFTQVSRHLEGDLPDGLLGQIQRERLVPPFKQQNYSKGILDTIQAYAATLAAKRGFSIEGIDERYAYREAPAERVQRERGGIGLGGLCCGIILVVFIIILLSASRGGRGGGRGGRGRRRGGGSGLLEALIWASVFSNLSGGRRGGSSSGWGGGSFGGGGFGGGGGGFGGGFGGGGDFGGGGAGGSW